MRRKLLPLMFLASILAVACAIPKAPSLTQSLAQTKTLVPTVNCGEDKSDFSLPPYPDAPASETVESLHAYGKQQQLWAIAAAGVVSNERILRANTAICLKTLRDSGVIN
jgi:hypothetical protein